MRTRLTFVSGLTGAEMEKVLTVIKDGGLAGLAEQRGFRGYAVFGNPDAGRGGLATGWADDDALAASAPAHHDLQLDAIGAIDYRRTPIVEDYDVLTWNVPPMDPEGRRDVHLRLGRITGLSLADLAPVRDAIHHAWVPKLDAIPGFLGYAILGNVQNGTGGMATMWSSRMSLSRSTQAEDDVYRAAAHATVGSTAQRTIDRFEMFTWDVPGMPATLIADGAADGATS